MNKQFQSSTASILIKSFGRGAKTLECAIFEAQKHARELDASMSEAQKTRLQKQYPGLSSVYNTANGKFHMFLMCVMQFKAQGRKDAPVYTVNQINRMGLMVRAGEKRACVVVIAAPKTKKGFAYQNMFTLDQTCPSKFTKTTDC